MSDIVHDPDNLPPAERSVPVEPIDGRTVEAGWTGPTNQFGRGRVPGVQPPYYAIRAFAIRLHNLRPKDARVFNMPADPDDLGPLTGDLCGPIQTKYVFTPGVNVASCMVSGMSTTRHPAPDPGCMCGFYAYLRPDAPDARPGPNGYVKSPLAHVQGVVAMSGHRLVGTEGIRAERLRIVALAGGPEPGENIVRAKSEDADLIRRHADVIRQRVMDKYDVPFFASTEAMLRVFPITRLAQQDWPKAG